MEDTRQKALSRFAKLQRVAADERCPEGERQAAKARADAMVSRHEFTPAECAQAIQAEARSEESLLAKAQREQREHVERIHAEQRRRQQFAAEAMRRQRAGGVQPAFSVWGEVQAMGGNANSIFNAFGTKVVTEVGPNGGITIIWTNT